MSDEHPPLSFVGETYAEKAERKFKENPIVPLGALATTAALAMAMVKMRRNDAKSFNTWLRMRVVFQGLTIVAVCASTYSFGLRRAPNAEQQGDDEKRRREEKLKQQREEFAARMKEAEETHEVETGFAKAVSDGKAQTRGVILTEAEKKAKEREIRRTLGNRAEEGVNISVNPPAIPPTSASQQKSSGGWKSWFGL